MNDITIEDVEDDKFDLLEYVFRKSFEWWYESVTTFRPEESKTAAVAKQAAFDYRNGVGAYERLIFGGGAGL